MDTWGMAYGTWWASINSTIGYLCCKHVPAFSFPAVWTFRGSFQSKSWYAIPHNYHLVNSPGMSCPVLIFVQCWSSRLTPLIGLAKEDLPLPCLLKCLLIIGKVVILRRGCFLSSAIWVPQIVSMHLTFINCVCPFHRCHWQEQTPKNTSSLLFR